jgi:alpha-1,3/alpha-1,6-mannosyltransferase
LGADWDTFLSAAPVFLSINRFERKKGLSLALRALAELRASDDPVDVRLVLAGGYDARLPENVEHLAELRAEVELSGLTEFVRFYPSFGDAQRRLLLASSTAVLYTPVNEHFGIVPLEAMAAGRPVIACDSGGPRESIGDDGVAGILCEPTPAEFAAAMSGLLKPGRAEKMGRAARNRVRAQFSRDAFGRRLVEILKETCNDGTLLMSEIPTPGDKRD